MQVRVLVFRRRQVPDGDGELGRRGEVGVGDRQLQPFVPLARVLKGLVCRLYGYSKGLAVCPYLGGDVQLKVGAVDYTLSARFLHQPR
jgi:hypothetical protein